MEGTPIRVIQKTAGDTVYIIELAISQNAKETAYDKLKHMILNDAADDRKLAS